MPVNHAKKFWKFANTEALFSQLFGWTLSIYFISVWVLIKMVINRKLLLRLILIYPRMPILIFEKYKHSTKGRTSLLIQCSPPVFTKCFRKVCNLLEILLNWAVFSAKLHTFLNHFVKTSGEHCISKLVRPLGRQFNYSLSLEIEFIQKVIPITSWTTSQT